MSVKSKMMGTTWMSVLAVVYDGRREALTELPTEASDRKVDQARQILELLDILPDEKREIVMSVVRQLAEGFSK